MANEPRISVRVSEELKTRLGNTAKYTQVDEAVLVRAALTGLVDYVEKHGRVTFPLHFSLDPKSDAHR
jgi:predicted DNA-binding protein